jgi:xanthine dehydrogenase accessory factor
MMIVVYNSDLLGSLGGGLMEHNLVEKAKELLKESKTSAFIKKQTHNKKSKNSSGMICSGTQTIAFNFFDKDDLETIQKLLIQTSIIHLSNHGLKLVESEKIQTQIESEEDWSYLEKAEHKQVIHLFGAGHVSLPTSELLNKLGYIIHLYDNRTGINTFDQNCIAKTKTVIDYQKVLETVSLDPQDYVILMTHKCAEDMLILSQLLSKDVAYLGVLGSNNKIKMMFDYLLEKGSSKQALDKVFAPIGLAIKSQTPYEIAVSIAAELIQFSNK